MKLTQWRKDRNAAARAKGSAGSCLQDIDTDLMQALSEIPPMQLAKIDEAFVLLDSGLGAIFSAGMARRAAVQRTVLKKTMANKGSLLELEEENSKDHARQTLRRATMRIIAPIRRQAAQTATLKMMSDLVGPHTLKPETERSSSKPRRASFLQAEGEEGKGMQAGKTTRVSLEEAPPSPSEPRSPKRRKSKKKSSMKLDPKNFMTAPAPVAVINVDDHPIVVDFPEECNVPPSCQLQEDQGFRLWARDQLRIQPHRLQGLEKSQTFRKKVGHQMLCWQALHVDKVSVTASSSASRTPTRDLEHETHEDAACRLFGSPEDSSCFASVFSSPQSSAYIPGEMSTTSTMAGTGTSTREPSVEFQTAAHSLFGLARYQDAQMMRRSRTPLRASPHPHGTDRGPDIIGQASPEQSRVAGASPVPLLERHGQVPASASQGHHKENNAWSLTVGRRPHEPQSHHDVAPRSRLQVLDADSPADRPSSRDSTYSHRLPSRGQACEPPLGVALRRPPAFVEPHRDIPSTLVVHTPELLYLRRCEVQGLIPCPAVWRKFGDSQCSVIDASKRGLSDADVGAIVETAVECAADGHELHKLNLSHNAVTDVGAQRVAHLIAGPTMICSMLTSLSLAGNAALKLRSDGLLKDLANLFSALTALSELDLSGVPVHGRAASILCQALQKSASLKSLSLAGCDLGRLDQTECKVIAALLGYSGDERAGQLGLESFDLSSNFFGRLGFTAAAGALRRSCLKRLSFASNCAGVSAHNTNKDHAQFHPIQLLIEGLQFNKTVEVLDLSDCSLGPDSAFVLEDAIQSHKTLTSLDLSQNPLGDAGLRCVLRLILALGVDIHICTVCGHREADLSAHTVKFRYTQPGGGYRLNLKYPHERAALRFLLRISERATQNPFRYFKFDAKQVKPNIEKDSETDRWMVPAHGTYNFSFQPPLSDTAMQYSLQARAGAATGSSPPSRRASKDSIISGSSGKGTSHESNLSHRCSKFPATLRISMMNAITGNTNYVSKSRRSRPSSLVAEPTVEIDWGELTELLSTARIHVSALRYPLVRSMFLSLITREQQSRFILACSKDIAFNGPQVSQLCEDRPELGLEIIGALFPSIGGRTAQLLLLSHFVNQFSPAACMEVSDCLWFQEGNLTGRYHLDLSKPADYAIAENCLLVNAWESEVGRLMGRPDISQRGNHEMLRNESHNEVPFTFTREWSLPSSGWFKFDYSSIRRAPVNQRPMPEAGEVTCHLQRSNAAPEAKLRALRAVSIHVYLSSQQFRGLLQCFPPSTCRQSFFCQMHTRIVDRQRLLSHDLVYSDLHFNEEDRAALFERVGHLHLLNPLHPEGIVYKCNLENYEERQVIDFLVQLRSKEPGGRIQGVPYRYVDDQKHGPVPASWADKGVPEEDLEIKCQYETTHPNPQWRQTLAEKYCIGNFQ